MTNKPSKKHIKTKLFSLVIILTMVFQFVPTSVGFAQSETDSPFDQVKLNSKFAVVIDAHSGNVIYDHNASSKIYPASTSKVMTAIVAMENSKMDDVLTVSQNALKGQEDNGAHIGLHKDEELTMKDALYGLWIESANDAAITIAENVSGSEEEFAKLLNKKAKELKLEHSHFVTPNGLYDKNHYTTVKDLATITAYALQNPDFYEMITTHKHELPPTNMRNKKVTIYTSHPMAPYKYNAYPYIVGGKTGYVPESKCNMITVAEKNDIQLICVTGKTNSLYNAADDAKSLLDAGFKSMKKDIITRDGKGMTLPKLLDSGNYVTRHSAVKNNSIPIVIPKTASMDDITFKLNERELMFPVNKGTTVGSVSAIYQGNVVGTSEVYAKEDLTLFLFVVYSAFKIFLYALPVILIILIGFAIRRKLTKKSHKKVKGPKTYVTETKTTKNQSPTTNGNKTTHYNRTTKK